MKKKEQKPIEEEASLDKEKELKLKKLLCKFMNAEEAQNEAISAYNEMKTLTLKAFKSLGIKKYSFEEAEDRKGKKNVVSFFITKRTNVYYDVNKLKATIGKKLAEKIIMREYSISDYDTFKEIMKKYKVPPEALRKCIEIKETVDSGKLQNAFESGLLDLKKIKDCYTLSITEYISKKSTSK